MQKIMLIGDSIRLSYQERVQQLLADAAVVTGPAENCRFAAYTLFCLASWVTDDDYDVIHWNNGQWDSCYMPDGRIHTALPLYLDLQQRIAEILRPRTERLVFATTTPVHADQYEKAERNGRKNEDIEAYNRAVVETLVPMGVEINDMHWQVATDVRRYVSEDKVHLTAAGVELCAGLVVEAVTR